jgi:hypothetical protein
VAKKPVVMVIFERYGPHVAQPEYQVDENGIAVLDDNGEPIPVDHPTDCGECEWHWNILDLTDNAGGSIAFGDKGFKKLDSAVNAAERKFKDGSIGDLEQVNDNKWQIAAYA